MGEQIVVRTLKPLAFISDMLNGSCYEERLIDAGLLCKVVSCTMQFFWVSPLDDDSAHLWACVARADAKIVNAMEVIAYSASEQE